MGIGDTRRVRRSHALAVVGLAIVAVGWSTAGRAFAHAELLAITPPDGAILDAAPAEAELLFNEPVSLTGGSARVLDDRGNPVSGEPQVVDDAVVVPLPGPLADGTYTLSWQVISEDSHRITGASLFHVGAPSAGGAVAAPDGDDVDWGVRSLAWGLTALTYAAALAGVGAWWFGELVARRRDATSFVVKASLLGATAAIAALPARIARLGGGLDALRDWDFVWESLRGPVGASALVTALGLVALALAAGRPQAGIWPWVGVAGSAAALAGFVVEGHTRTMTPRWAMVGFDLVHLAAGAVWLGGLAVVVLAFRHGTARDEQSALVVQFSNTAVIAVLAVTGAGIGMSWIVLPSLEDLWSTGYGLALLVKVVLVAVVVVLGAYNRRALVPAMSGGAAAARRRLARIVSIELAVLLAVVGVTAVLVARSPVSATSAPPAAPAPLPDAVVVPLTGSAGEASMTLAPARAGSNEIRLVLTAADGTALQPLETPTVELTEPTLQLGPLRPLVHPFGDGEFHVIADVPLAGSWEVTVRVRISDFEAATATATFDVTD